MPDLMTHYTRVCASVMEFEKAVRGSDGKKEYLVRYGKLPPGERHQYGWTCTCPAFKFGKAACKHIEQVKPLRCGWNEEAFVGDFREAEGDVCPDCGGPLRYVEVGV